MPQCDGMAAVEVGNRANTVAKRTERAGSTGGKEGQLSQDTAAEVAVAVAIRRLSLFRGVSWNGPGIHRQRPVPVRETGRGLNLLHPESRVTPPGMMSAEPARGKLAACAHASGW